MKEQLARLYKSNSFLGRAFKILAESVPYDYIKSSNYKKNIQRIKNFENLSKEEINDWKYKKLSMVIKNAYENVPFYNDLYKKAGFHPDDFLCLNDLSKIPMISKKDIRKTDNFINKKFNTKNLIPSYSGGSTATPLKIFIEKDQADIEASYYDYIWTKYGYHFGKDKCVIVKGDKIAHRNSENKLILAKENKILKTLILDSDYLNKLDYIDNYLCEIKNFNADVLFGYPSSIYQLAKLFKASNKRTPSFKLVLLASENTYVSQNKFIKKVFDAKDLFYHYGHSEQVLAAYKNQHSDDLAFIPSYGHVELIKDNKNIIGNDDTSIGELVGTNYSIGFPLIRYRTNDYARNSTKKNSMFADNMVVQSIEGRLQEFIVTKDMRLVSLVSVAGAHLKSISKARDSQYCQNKPGYLTLNIVQNNDDMFSKKDIMNVHRELDAKFENTVKTSINFVDRIYKSESNKKTMIKQDLNLSEYKL